MLIYNYSEVRGFVNKCRPGGLHDLVQHLNEQQLEAVKDIGFGGLLKISVSSIPLLPFVKMLVKSFNGISRMLTVNNRHSFLVTNYDICDVFLLPRHDGNNVLEMKRNESLEIMSVWKEKYGIDRVYPLSKLKNLIKERLTDGGDDFKRLFVLYSLSSFLTPTANGMVDFSALKALIDVEKIREVDWCSYVLKHLCKAVTKFNSSSEIKTVSGCVLVLLILYLHRLKWCGIAEPYSLPLIQHWSNEKLRRRVSEEMSAGALGEGEWVEGVYPVSLKSAAKNHEEVNLGKDALQLIQQWSSEGERVKDVYPPSLCSANHEEDCLGKDDCPGSKSDGKEMEDGSRFIIFELPKDEPSDLDIHKIAEDVSCISLNRKITPFVLIFCYLFRER